MEDNKNIDYFNIEIITDSTVVLQGSFVDGKFTFKLPGQKKHRLKISSMGYEDKIIDISATPTSMNRGAPIRSANSPKPTLPAKSALSATT